MPDLDLGTGGAAGASEASAALERWRGLAGDSSGVGGAAADVLRAWGGLVGGSLGGADCVGRLGGGVAVSGASAGGSVGAGVLSSSMTVVPVAGMSSGSSAAAAAVMLRVRGLAGWCWGSSAAAASVWCWGAWPAAGRSECLPAPLVVSRALAGIAAGGSVGVCAVTMRNCELEANCGGWSECLPAPLGGGVALSGVSAGGSVGMGAARVARRLAGGSAGGSVAVVSRLVCRVPLRGLCGSPGWERPQVAGASAGRSSTGAALLRLTGAPNVELSSA